MERPGPRRLVADRFRVPVLLLAVTGAGVVSVLGSRFAGQTRAGKADRAVAGLVDDHEAATGLLGQGIASLGGPVPVALALVALALLARVVRGPRGLALVLCGPPLAMVTTSLVLKPIVDRTHKGGLAFPSGHTTSVASLAVTAAVLLVGWVAVPPLVRWLGVVALAGLVAAVGVSLVGRGYHYATDTMGGSGIALAVVLTTALVVDAVADALARSRAPVARTRAAAG